MLLILIVALLAAALTAGAWYGRLQERAWWTRRLYERGINPNTLYPRTSEIPLEPLAPENDAMRDAMESMAQEVERLAEGQRFLTRVLTEKPPADGPGGGPAEPRSEEAPDGPPVDRSPRI